jgi:hypothetical protein
MPCAPGAFRRHPSRVFASEPSLQGSPRKKSIPQTSLQSPISGGGVGKRKETAITVSISRENVGIINRRPFSPALIAAHSGQALRRRLLHKSSISFLLKTSVLSHILVGYMRFQMSTDIRRQIFGVWLFQKVAARLAASSALNKIYRLEILDTSING